MAGGGGFPLPTCRSGVLGVLSHLCDAAPPGCVTPVCICAVWLIWQALNPAHGHAAVIAELKDAQIPTFLSYGVVKTYNTLTV